jgi:hypothetical protein
MPREQQDLLARLKLEGGRIPGMNLQWYERVAAEHLIDRGHAVYGREPRGGPSPFGTSLLQITDAGRKAVS